MQLEQPEGLVTSMKIVIFLLNYFFSDPLMLDSSLSISYFCSLGHPRIIHRDIKSSNILLDNNFEAQVMIWFGAQVYMSIFWYATVIVIIVEIYYILWKLSRFLILDLQG